MPPASNRQAEAASLRPDAPVCRFPRTSPLGSIGALALIVAMHALVLNWIVQLRPVRTITAAPRPIEVVLVRPEPPQPAVAPTKPIDPPKPAPIERRPPPRKPVVLPPPPIVQAAPVAAAPPTVDAPPPPPVAMPVMDAPRPFETSPPAPVEVLPPPPAPPTPAPLVPPIFSADYLANPAPAYPSLSRRAGEQGKVLVRVLVNAEGLPRRVELRDSSGFDRLDSAALTTIQQWKFVPARRGDQAVEAWVLIPINFNLRERD